jgi:purine-binding chemotaxis protein CheW
VSAQPCAIPVERVRELVHIVAITRTPGQPSILDGFLNLRGEAIPVLPLQRLLSLEAAPYGLYSVIVIISVGGRSLGLLADSVQSVVTVPVSELRKIGGDSSFNDCAAAQFDYEGTTAIVLDCERILLEEEKQRIADLTAQVQARLGDLQSHRV